MTFNSKANARCEMTKRSSVRLDLVRQLHLHQSLKLQGGSSISIFFAAILISSRRHPISTRMIAPYRKTKHRTRHFVAKNFALNAHLHYHSIFRTELAFIFIFNLRLATAACRIYYFMASMNDTANKGTSEPHCNDARCGSILFRQISLFRAKMCHISAPFWILLSEQHISRRRNPIPIEISCTNS
jgi:hypothetical protein